MLGFGMRQAARRNRASSVFDRMDLPTVRTRLVGSSATLAAYDPADASTVARAGGGRPTLPTDAVAELASIRPGGGYTLTPPDGARAPQWRNGALTFDGVDGMLWYDAAPGPALDLVMIYKGSDRKGVLASAGPIVFASLWDASETVAGTHRAVGSPTVLVDGSEVASQTRAAYANAVATGSAVVVEVRNGDFTEWPRLAFANLVGNNSFASQGILIPVAILDPRDADIAQAREDAAAHAADLVRKLGL